MRAFGVDLMVIRLVSLGLTLATALLTYALGRDLYDRDTGFAAAWLLLTMPLFLRVGSAGLTDMPVTFFFTLAMFAALRLLRTPAWHSAVTAGLAVGAGLLSKYTMVFVYPVLLSCFAVSGKVRQRKGHLGLIALVSGGILALWLVFAYQRGILAAQSERLAFYAGVVTTTSGGRRWMLEAVLLRLPSALGTYNLPLLLLGEWQLIRDRSLPDRLVGLWVAMVATLLILTLPDPRYFLPIFPALAIAMARGLERIPQIAERAVILALLYCGGALYLFADWYRSAEGLLR
jgi:4-amino-4-deoxy-L-arabinose transferase-like glycosyltransferase